MDQWLLHVIVSLLIFGAKCHELNGTPSPNLDDKNQNANSSLDDRQISVYARNGSTFIPELDERFPAERCYSAPAPVLPLDQIGTSFGFYLHRSYGSEYYNLSYSNMTKFFQDFKQNHGVVNAHSFGLSVPLVIATHGFLSSFDDSYLRNLSKRLQGVTQDNNYIAVDWKKGAMPPRFIFPNYQTAVANTRVVAAQIVQLIGNLTKYISFPRTTLIGHSLGAHIMGDVGKRIKLKKGVLVESIIGLDPAGPCFTGRDDSERLDSSDANYVQVIYTDTTLYGIEDILGHVNVFPNGGRNQPGCMKFHGTRIEYVKKYIFSGSENKNEKCSHSRAPELFVSDGFWNPATKCRFAPVPCTSLSDYRLGKCSFEARPLATIIKIHNREFLKPKEDVQKVYFTFNTTRHYPSYCGFNVIFSKPIRTGVFSLVLTKRNKNSPSGPVIGELKGNDRLMVTGIIEKVRDIDECLSNHTCEYLELITDDSQQDRAQHFEYKLLSYP